MKKTIFIFLLILSNLLFHAGERAHCQIKIVSDTIFVNSLGAKGNGIADDTKFIQKAIDYAEKNGKKNLKFQGKYKITQYITLKSNIDYFFGKAEFVMTQVHIPLNFMFYGENIKNFRLIDGVFKMGNDSANIVIGTGKYTNYAAVYIKGSSDFKILNGYFERMFVGLNIYNSSRFTVSHNLMQDCNAGIAVVAENGSTGSNFFILDNQILSCGDDGVFVGSIGGYVNNGIVSGNSISKTTRRNGELDGNEIAAVGIRLGKYHFNTPEVFFISNVVIDGNKLWDMTNQGVFVHNCSDIIIKDNTIAGYAKNISTASPAIQIGETNGMGAKNILLSGNTIENPKNDMPFLKIVDAQNVSINDNHIIDKLKKVSTKVITMGHSKDVIYRNNEGL